MNKNTVYTFATVAAVAVAASLVAVGVPHLRPGSGSGTDRSAVLASQDRDESPQWDSMPMQRDAAATRPVNEPETDWGCVRSGPARCGYTTHGDGWVIQPYGDGYEFVVYQPSGDRWSPTLRSDRWPSVNVVGAKDLTNDGIEEIVVMFSSPTRVRVDVISVTPSPSVPATMSAAVSPGTIPAVQIEEEGVAMRPDPDKDRQINVGVALDGTWTKNRQFTGTYVPTSDQMS